MPFYLKESDILSQVAGLKSVLIVPCRFCPAVSMAVRENKPYIQLLRNFLRTEAYESFIKALKHRLQYEGIKTVVFDSILPHHFVACMWTVGRRSDFAKLVEKFEGVVILGCDALVETVSGAIKHFDCRVIKGMEVEGIMTVVPTVSFPLNISLKMQSITSIKMEKLKE